jgi:hypothetical protein
MKEPIEIFFCYACEDEPFRQALEKHLREFKRQGVISIWHDQEISAGDEWESEIDKHLNSARLILLLVSPDFLGSEYCYSIEMKRALERHEQDEALVIPIIVRPVYWQTTPFSQLRVLPADGKPLTDQRWHTLDDAFLNVVEGIRSAIETLSQPAQKGSDWTHKLYTNPPSPIVVTSKILDVDYIATAGQGGKRVLVPASGHIVRLTVEANDSRTTIIQNLCPIVLSRSEPTGNLSIHYGVVTPRPFEVLLDEEPPRLKPVDPAGPHFPFKVGPGDPEIFDLKVLTSTGDVKWRLDLSWTCLGQEGILHVDLGGSPFRTMARPRSLSAS